MNGHRKCIRFVYVYVCQLWLINGKVMYVNTCNNLAFIFMCVVFSV